MDPSEPALERGPRTRSAPTLHYTLREARGRDAKHTLVFSHALGGDAGMWDAVADRLAASHRVVCYDHRGHGDSAAPQRPYTMAQLADDAAALIDELQAGPVVWVGLSLGGMVGQELALREPARLKALVIANSSARFDEAGRAAWLERIASIEAGGMEAVADGAMARWFSPAFHQMQPATVARWRRRVASNLPRAYIAASHAVRLHDTLDRLAQVRVPTLVIAGELDQGTPVAMSQAIATRVPDARLLVMPGVAHLSALEQPAAFSAHLEDFLSALG